MKKQSLLSGSFWGAKLRTNAREIAVFAGWVMVLFIVMPLGLRGQEAGVGIIEGRVYNERTGRYVNRAQVTLEGTGRQVFTNNYGEYTFYDVPAGDYTVEAFLTGMKRQRQAVSLAEGGRRQVEIRLGARAGDEQMFDLEEFVVDGSDYQSMSELSIQEERFSVNLKNVVSADSYGLVSQGNIGEFVKFIPGVLVNYGGTYASGADASSISLRGFGADKTSITIDGVPISNAQPGSLSRTVGLDMMSINNASRVEVIKVPTPDQPSAGVSGTVNIISKSAFEYAKPTLNFRVYLSMNSENLEIFKKTPGPVNKKTYKAQPSFDFSYAIPINKKFGLTISLASANQFNENHSADIDYETRADDGPIPAYVTEDGERIEPIYADVAHPFLNNLGITDAPRMSHRHSGSITLDYRPWDGHLIKASYQGSVFEGRDAARRFEMSTNGFYGVQEYGPDFMISRPDWGLAETNVTALDREGVTHTGYLKWNFIKGPWDIRTHGSYSLSDGEYISAKNGHFSEVQLERRGIHHAAFYDIEHGIPGRVEYMDEDGNEIDTTKLDAYNVAGYVGEDPESSQLRVLAGESLSQSEIKTAKFDIRRDLDFLPFDFMNVAVKAGAYLEERFEEKWGRGTTYGFEYIGASGVSLDTSQFRDDVYRNVDPGFGLPPREWPDVYKLYDFYQDNPSTFSDTHDEPIFNEALQRLEPSVAAENWRSYVNTQKSITETNLSHYYQVETDLFNNRLSVVGGVRQETSQREGKSPFRDSDWMNLRKPVDENGDGFLDLFIHEQYGTAYLTSPMSQSEARAFEEAGAVYPDGTAFDADAIPIHDRGRGEPVRGQYVGDTLYGYLVPGTLQSHQYEYVPNYQRDEESKGRPSPIISSSFDITDQWVFRVSWTKTYAKPDYEGPYGVLQNVRIDEDDDGGGGRIDISNPSLDPWESKNWDFGLAYYPEGGGKISLVYYMKDIQDFHVDRTLRTGEPGYEEMLTMAGLDQDSRYTEGDWEVTMPVNGEGTATTYGYEFEIAQDLAFIGSWGKYFYAALSYTTKRESGNQDSLDQIGNTTDDFATASISFDYKRFSARVNATWQNETIRSSGSSYLWPDPSVGPPSESTLENEPYRVEVYRYEPAELKIDLNLAYRLTDNFTLDFSARNITNTARETYFRSADGSYPEYAQILSKEEFGVQFTVGMSAEF